MSAHVPQPQDLRTEGKEHLQAEPSTPMHGNIHTAPERAMSRNSQALWVSAGKRQKARKEQLRSTMIKDWTAALRNSVKTMAKSP